MSLKPDSCAMDKVLLNSMDVTWVLGSANKSLPDGFRVEWTCLKKLNSSGVSCAIQKVKAKSTCTSQFK